MEYQYYSEVVERKVDWLWYPYIPYGKITLLQGDPGDGKSTFILNLIAILTTGNYLPDGTKLDNKERVIYQCAEDSAEDTVKPRLLQAGADCDKVAFIVEGNRMLSLDDARWEKAILELGARLVVLDPIQAFIPPDGDMHSATKMRSTLRRLAAVAERQKCAVVLIGHMNKASGGKKMYRSLGSIDIAALSRSILMISRDKYDSRMRYMFPVKSSLAPEGKPIGFYMDETKGFQWVGVCDVNINDDGGVGNETSSQKMKARRLLLNCLADGDVSSKEISEIMERAGISEMTKRRAKKELGIEIYRRDLTWFWHLPLGNE